MKDRIHGGPSTTSPVCWPAVQRQRIEHQHPWTMDKELSGVCVGVCGCGCLCITMSCTRLLTGVVFWPVRQLDVSVRMHNREPCYGFIVLIPSLLIGHFYQLLSCCRYKQGPSIMQGHKQGCSSCTLLAKAVYNYLYYM